MRPWGAAAEGLYQFRGVSQPDVSFELKANSVRTIARGERQIQFADGGELQVEYPNYYMRGGLLPDRCAIQQT